MKKFKGFVKLENVSLGLGLFDGVHIGHKEVISQLITASKESNGHSAVITFSSSPAEKFISNVKYITLQEEKEKLLSDLGIDYMIELDFNSSLMYMEAEEYLKTIYKYFHPNYIITGFNHTFGKNKCGNSKMLENFQEKFNYKYKEIPPFKYNNEIVSSTLIRTTLENGDIEKANKLLGREYKIAGLVIKGDQIGRTLGFPTANIEYPDKKVEIPYGVYSVKANISGEIHKAILNYGIKPTINNKKRKPVAEVHIIGFNKDIYNQNLEISILKKIRNERTFNSLEELEEQIKRDIEIC